MGGRGRRVRRACRCMAPAVLLLQLFVERLKKVAQKLLGVLLPVTAEHWVEFEHRSDQFRRRVHTPKDIISKKWKIFTNQQKTHAFPL